MKLLFANRSLATQTPAARKTPGLCLGLMLAGLAVQAAAAADPSLTIYNQNFAVVRDTVPLDLKAGSNQVGCAAAAFLEPASVMLRDSSGKNVFEIREQNFRGDPISQEKLLELNEGKTIDFEVRTYEGAQARRELIRGKIIRSNYDPRAASGVYYGGPGVQPLVEVDGKLRFGLPGQPIFPALNDNAVLKPELRWVIEAKEPARFDAELSYVTGEMRWKADYNLVWPERGDTLDLVGWITMENDSGRDFEHARIKLMAGDVNKIQAKTTGRYGGAGGGGMGGGGTPPPVTEKSFDEYHLYTLEYPTTLLDREKKQVEFIHSAGVKAATLYIYDGASADPDQKWSSDQVHTEVDYGTRGNTKVWVLREFANTAANHLGLPLPKGQVRLYRRGSDGQMEFIGENTIKHTPRDETLRLFTGMAFDLTGERKRTDFKSAMPGVDPHTGLPVPAAPQGAFCCTIDESFLITLRNHKREPVEIRVVEHLYRWVNWEIRQNSHPFTKMDSETIEFRILLQPDAEQKVTYTAHYWW